jgi:hypothetical protein
MSRFLQGAAIAGAVALLAGCGYVGDPMPPALMIPVPVNDLTAVERGERIIIEFSHPGLTTEQLVLDRFGEVDLRIGPVPIPWDLPTWLEGARRLDVPDPRIGGPMRIETPAAKWAGREVMIAARTAGPKGRLSEWSNLVALTVVEPLAKPGDLQAGQVREGVRLTWSDVDGRLGLRFRVFRRGADSGTQLRLGETEEPEWIDSGAQYGETYSYLVQAVMPAHDDLAESALTESAVVTPADIFPPPVPSGLAAIAGLNTIELTWEGSPEAGAVIYRLYRAEGDGELQPIAESLAAPGYSDTAIASGQRYRYAVSAVDELGNESEISGAVEQVAP